MQLTKTIVFLSILFLSSQAFAADVTLTWDANSPEDQVVGYKLYYNEWSQLTGNVTEYTLTNLTPGNTYSIYATAYNNHGESGPSNTVTYAVPPFVITDNPKESIVIEFNGTLTLKQ